MKSEEKKTVSSKSFLTLHIDRISTHVDKLEKQLFLLRQNEQQFTDAYFDLKSRVKNSREVLKQLQEQNKNDN